MESAQKTMLASASFNTPPHLLRLTIAQLEQASENIPTYP